MMAWQRRLELAWRKRIYRRLAILLYRLDRAALVDAFRRLGVVPGTTLCVHSSLSRLGHVVGGAETLIQSLIETVGPSGTLMMPSFPTAGSMARRLQSGEIFDARSSPSKVGRVTEIFRRRSDVRRSLHPTNPMAAWGERADWILADHWRSQTPYGLETPYGRLATLDDSYILMIETHVQSLLHHLQERVEFPNLFLDGTWQVPVIDHAGRQLTVTSRAMRPRIPYFVAIPAPQGDEPRWAILHDYALMFPPRRRRIARRLGYRFDGYPPVRRRRQMLIESGILRTMRLGGGTVGLLNVARFLAVVEPELRGLIERYRVYYDPERIAKLGLQYG